MAHQNKVCNLELTKRYLDVIQAQNNAFLSQVGTFIETLNNNQDQIKNFEPLKKNICHTFKFSSQINEMIVECKNDVNRNLYQAMYLLKLDKKVSKLPSNDQSDFIQNKAINSQSQPENQMMFEPNGFIDSNIANGNIPDINPLSQSIFQVNSSEKQKEEMEERLVECLNRRASDEEEANQKLFFNSINNFKDSFEYNKSIKENTDKNSFVQDEDKVNGMDRNPKLNTEQLSSEQNQNSVKFNPESSFCKTFEFFFGKKEPNYDPFDQKSSSKYSIGKNTYNKLNFDKKNDQYSGTQVGFDHQSQKRERGSYNICTMQIKNEALSISKTNGIRFAAELLNIPEKNIKRWLKQGPERKKGAGRKTMDPDMEQGLLDWIAEVFRKSRVFPDFKEVKLQAKIFSSNGNFKASKGWCDKFMKRNSTFFDMLRNEAMNLKIKSNHEYLMRKTNE